jgi:hypothetical protein
MRQGSTFKAARIVGLSLVLLVTFSPIGSPVARADEAADPIDASVPAVDAGWWGMVQENIRQSEYDVTWQEGTYLDDVPAAYQAPNRAHNLRTYFTPQGPIVIPRVWHEETDSPPWRWEVRLAAWGRPGGMEAVPPAALEVQENRIDYRRGDPAASAGQGLAEWAHNDDEGLGQGWRIAAPPPAGGTGVPLQLDLILAGDLSPQIQSSGTEVEFTSADGQPVLRYRLLAATDAAGRALPAWLSLSGDTLSILVDDSAAEYPLQVEASLGGLPIGWNWRVEGEADGDEFGCAVNTAGDVSGDGYSDVIVGAPKFDGGKADQGKAYVFLGHAGGLDTDPIWTKASNLASAQFGRAVSTAGDVNGDGYADVIVGAPYWSDGESEEGAAWIYYGRAGDLNDAPSHYLQGNQDGAYLGIAVSTAGDVNGDGVADVIVGASHYDSGSTDEGIVRVWYGPLVGMSPAADWQAESNQGNAHFGNSVATAGDVNGDGWADLIVGAPEYDGGETDEGSVFVWHGHSSGVNHGVAGTPLNAAWTKEPDQASALFGVDVNTAGDVNGDGFADVIVGASYWESSAAQADEGGIWIYRGSAAGLVNAPAAHKEGDQAYARFGTAVSTAGDVNGDGYADVIAGAPDYGLGYTRDGRAWVWLGSPDWLGDTPHWSAGGHQNEAHFGSAAATAGDVNGDGYSDIIVGALGYEDPATSAALGAAYVYHGSVEDLSEMAVWSKRSNMAQAYYGWSVGSAGDVNGDGYADVIVSAPFWNGQGQVWVYHGTATGLDSSPAWDKSSGHDGDDFGWSAGAAGDVNGDGYDDVIVGAPGWEGQGAAFVYAGSAGGMVSAPLWNKESGQVGSRFGFSVGTAGDVNGDGYADIIVGAPFWQTSGQERGGAWLYYGSDAGPHRPPDWYEVADRDDAEYGYAVGTAGDVNGDGYSDVIIGSPRWYDDVINEGRAWVYLGSDTGLSHALHWHAESNKFDARLGHAVGTAGDVDGDGYSDVIVGAPYYDDAGLESEGKVWVFLGSWSGLDSSADWSRESGQNHAYYGYSVGTAGDVNGDGYADVILGAAHMTGSVSDEGTARVYLGSNTGLPNSYHWKGEGGQTLSWYGQSVATAGDVNGDGYADVIVGAPQYNYGDSLNEGRASLYYGNGGPGVSLRPRQRHVDGAPLAHLGLSDDLHRFQVGLLAGTPFGRGRILLECEVKPLGTPFTGSGTFLWGGFQNAVPGQNKYLVPHDLPSDTLYHWRVRWRFSPATTPFMPASRWLTVPWNGWNEADLRIGISRALLPIVLRNYH